MSDDPEDAKRAARLLKTLIDAVAAQDYEKYSRALGRLKRHDTAGKAMPMPST